MKLWFFVPLALGLLAFSRVGVGVVEQDVGPEDQLEFVIVEVNGDTRKVAANGEVVAVVGDVVEIKAAVLGNPQKKALSVNLVGFQSPKAATKGEDRGYQVKTDRDLIKVWSVHKNGELYRVRAASGSVIHGEVYLRLIKPQIKFAELVVNGRKRILREGELLRLKKTDQIAVKNVRTNIDNDTKEVDFQIIPNEDLELPGVKLFEIRFSRAGSVFAKIPMQVEGYETQP